MSNITPKQLSRFWSKVEKTGSCWIWTAYKNKDGYGGLKLNKKWNLAHRFAYEITKGEIPLDKELDHLCRNRACVNPDHLEAVTHQENMIRGESFIIKNASKTHCLRGHLLSSENLIPYELEKNNKRICRLCRNLRVQNSRKHLI